MTKLEEKLIELGYEQNTAVIEPNKDIVHYLKKVNEYFEITLENNTKTNEIKARILSGLYFAYNRPFHKQQAFNEMQRDLEVLKQCQD